MTPANFRAQPFGPPVAMLLLLSFGCSGDDAGGSGGGDSSRDGGNEFGNAPTTPGGGSSSTSPGGGSTDSPDSGPSSVVSWEGCKLVDLRKLDLLFVVDNSGSMREEQASLRREFPKLVNALTTGDLDGNGVADYPPVQDLHLGVISTDLGLPGISGIPGCEGAGDDGVLQHTPSASLSGCANSYPSFLTYRGDQDDPAQVADDFACIASLGTDGCGFEQQLEAPLKALTPSTDTAITFLSASGGSNLGQGDTENAGFARAADETDPSVLGIVLVTDEEDCSMQDSRFLTPPNFLDPMDVLASQPLNLRCFHNADHLFSIDRYVNGLRRLRPGREELVVFAAITGVPPELVDPAQRSMVNFADQAERDAYYDAILADPSMQETIDPNPPPMSAGSLIPSCNTANGKAYPPRRIVELARRMGESGIVQSICQDDFGPAMSEIIEVLAQRVEDLCNVE